MKIALVPHEKRERTLSLARRLAAEIEGAYLPNQYSNPANPEAHYLTTGPEIWEQTGGEVDVFTAGVGTGGTISGAGRYLKERKPGVEVVGADPEGSIFTAPSEDEVHQYKVEGVGEDFWPETFDPGVVDRYVMVNDRQSFGMARRLARTEGILAGGSAGMALHAAVEASAEDESKLVVVLLPDSGRGYLSKIWNDEYSTRHGLDGLDGL